ncbi:MAG: hypothetical protein AAF220_11950 [Pseudomonadota bacterium]
MPDLLLALSETVSPSAAFLRFDSFLQRLPAGVQLFSMFTTNPQLLRILADIMGTAPMLAEILSRHPSLLERILIGDMDAPLGSVPALSGALALELQSCEQFEDVLTRAQRWVNDRKFQVGVQILRGTTDGEHAAEALTNLAEATVIQAHNATAEYFASAHGHLARGGMAIVGLGKLGGREMTVGSDLDLVFVYDEVDPVAMSDGPKPLAASTYFARLSQRLIAAITAPTGEGTLYEVDMRLRPSGNAGPIACSLEAYRRYHEKNAWTWEHMALIRARVVSGPPDLIGKVENTIRDTLIQPRDPDQLLHDVAEMRARVLTEKAPQSPWDVKLIPGGLLDIEFIIQYLQLRHASHEPEILSPEIEIALARLEHFGFLSSGDTEILRENGRFFRRIQGLQRLTTGDHVSPRNSSQGVLMRFAKEAGEKTQPGDVDFDALEQILQLKADQTRAVFERLVANPANLP